MSLLSIQSSVPRTGNYTAAAIAVRAVAILTVLLLAAAVEVAAANYFDPEHAVDAAQSILAW